MQNLLGTENKTHMIVFWDKEKKPVSITARQADVVREFLKDKDQSFIDMYNADGKLADIFNKRAIQAVVERNREDVSTKKQGYYCEYGGMHDMDSECGAKTCGKHFNGALAFQVWDFYKQLCPNLQYIKEVTPQMRKQAILHFSKL